MFCLHAFSRDPLSISERIIHRSKDIFKAITAPLESYDHGESNAVGCKDFGSELAEDVGIYRETIKGAQIRNIGAFLSWKLLSSSSSSFVVTLPSVLGRFQWCLG